MTDASTILSTRKKSTFTLTEALAEKAREVIKTLPKTTMCRDLYWQVPPEWIAFLASLTSTQRGTLTRAFSSLVPFGLSTIEDMRQVTQKQLIGWHSGKITAAFLFICFSD